MDGRVQLPVNAYLQTRFGADYVDTITEAGPDGVLGGEGGNPLVEGILERVEISMKNHGSVGLAIVGHEHCAGNPVCQMAHFRHLERARDLLREAFPQVPVIALWLGEDWRVQELK